MTKNGKASPERVWTDPSVRVLEVFADVVGMPLDRILASRILSEAERAIPGDDCTAWSTRLVEAGESVDLRVRAVECGLKEALIFVRQGIPVARCLTGPDDKNEWVLITAIRGRRVRLAAMDAQAADQWVPLRKLPERLGVPDTASPLRWVIGQAAQACSVAHDPILAASSPQPLSPLQRLLLIVRPERSDLWVIFVFSVLVGVLTLAVPIAVEALVNTVAFGRYLQPVIILALLLFAFLAFAAAVRGLLAFIVEILQRRLFIRVVEDFAYRIPRVNHASFDSVHGPELANRFFDVVTLQKSTAGLLLDGLAIVIQTVVGMIVLAFYHPFLLGYDILLLFLIVVTVFGLGRGAVRTAVKESKAKFAIGAWVEELARHPTAFKLHAGMQFALEKADQLALNWLSARRTHFRIVLRQILFALGLQAIAATVLLGLGGWLVIQTQLTLGQLVAAELIVMFIVGSFAKLGKHMESFYDLLAAVDKLGRIFDLPMERHDKLFYLQDSTPARVQVHGLTYKYDVEPILRNLSFQLAPGERVALAGPPACGKSTLIELLAGMRHPNAGHCEIDGIDIRELRPDSLREHLAVARTVEIFEGTIDENVHLHRPHISTRDVRDALSAVGLLDELLQLPEGLNANLCTYGAPLSSSQAQRLMIARAIVGRPRLLMIDETLDALSGPILRNILGHLMGDDVPWTLLVNSSRTQVLEACDRVIELPGRVPVLREQILSEAD
jgi:ABC-type bacteriocin/lantibiotic exporter with double-glycine peptidase domain